MPTISRKNAQSQQNCQWSHESPDMPNWIKRSLSAGVAAGTALFTFAVNVAWNVCAVVGASILIGAVFV
tara:strand:+ start:474 stop:680 length:207 start_codon:yes stop_codon:yes gene_type:complete